MLYLLSGCNSENAWDCFKTSGEIIEQEILLDAFHTIEVLDEVDVYLSNSEDQHVIIKAGKNLIPKINLKVKDEILTITNDNSCNWKRSPENPGIYIHSNDVTSIHIYDYINIYAEDTLSQNSLFIFSDGTGNFNMKLDVDSLRIESIYISNFEVSGNTDYLHLNFINDGQYYGKNLKSAFCKINHNGSNRIEVYPIESLKGTLRSTGSLYYYYDPVELDVTVSGIGKLIDMSD
jgi:hypothetical protein